MPTRPNPAPDEPRLARVAAQIAEPSRARMLAYLLSGEYASAGELAQAASVTPATASGHLAQLLDAGFVVCEARGRHRYYRLADGEIAHALEALALVAERGSHQRAWSSPQRLRLRDARCCYGHLAGALGVGLFDAMRQRGWLRPGLSGYALTPAGAAWLDQIGMDGPAWLACADGSASRRTAYACLDWSERRDHLAGRLARALLDHFIGRRWLRRCAGERALELTPSGRAALGPVMALPAAVVPLWAAFAHGDQDHARPLADALDHGFTSVEADVYLRPEGLLVGHDAEDLRPGRTLSTLYLDPLRERVKAGGGRVHRGGPTFYLLVDVKSEAEATYAALDRLLAGYADILSVTRDGRFDERAVTVMLSGNRAKETVARQRSRHVCIDGRLEDLALDAPAHLVPWISADWEQVFAWRGERPMPAAEKARLSELVRQAHGQGRQVRFWATPEKEAVWQALLDAGVDWINTDQLRQLQLFLLTAQGRGGRVASGS